MSLFTTFGSFSIFAGFLLIFLIFVMLAAERRGELGIAGGRDARGHLVQMFVYEGWRTTCSRPRSAPRLVSPWRSGWSSSSAAPRQRPASRSRHDVQAQSIVVAYALGVLLTFVVVAALGVARQPAEHRHGDPQPAGAACRKRRKRRWIGGLVAVALGALMTVSAV